MKDLRDFFDERMNRIIMIVEMSTRKIMKKEINKFRKDILKEMMQNG